MSAMVITMASSKGGSGKTIVTASFGTLLAALGKRVLMVDTDAATNGLSLFYINRVAAEALASNGPRYGLFELTALDEPDFIKVENNLYLLPATYEFRNTRSSKLDQFQEALVSFISHYRDDFDFIFLDAQAGSDAFAEVAVSKEVSDQVVIVSEYDPMSAAGVERLKALFPESLTYQRTWVLLNKMLPDFIKSFSDFLEIAKYLSPLPWNAEVVRAYARRALPIDLEVGNEYTLAVVQTLKSMLDEDTRLQLEIWLESRTAEIQEPVKVQLDEARRELSALKRQRAKIQTRERLIKEFANSLSLLIGVLSGLIYYVLGHTFTQSSTFALAITAVLTVVARPVSRLYSASRWSYMGSELESDISSAEDRVRRLRELSELSFEELIRKGRTARHSVG